MCDAMMERSLCVKSPTFLSLLFVEFLLEARDHLDLLLASGGLEFGLLFQPF